MDDLVIDSVQFVCPLVLVHSVFAPASDPNGFFQPACGFVRFLIGNSGGVPIDDMVVGRDMLSYGRFEVSEDTPSLQFAMGLACRSFGWTNILRRVMYS